MAWATNPLLKPKPTEQSEKVSTSADGSDLEAAREDDDDGPPEQVLQGVKTKFKVPSDKLTGHQIFYIFILDGIGAAILSGGINFGIAYAMYHQQDDLKKPVRLFRFPNTLAGDAALTVFIQILITWLIELNLVNMDLKKGGVQPIGFIREPRNRFMRWFMFLDRQKQTHEVRGFLHWISFLRSQVVRALLVAVACFPLMWGPSVGFLVLVGQKREDDWYYPSLWAPQVFKLVQGAVLGLLTTPPIVMFWLTRCGWALKQNEQSSGESNTSANEGDEDDGGGSDAHSSG
ncbi:hypothetical protein F4778DRAFT_380086 [Xylariomycetidae sp. FL2044]|nr:hypothetical protein F4778DRAFT_380086 [Xylariomycetidae sp. FL2044]